MSILDFIKSQDSRPETMNVTPHWIDELKDDEIFVFGCRRSGRHYERTANFPEKNSELLLAKEKDCKDNLMPYRQPVSDSVGFVMPIGCGLGLWDYDDITDYDSLMKFVYFLKDKNVLKSKVHGIDLFTNGRVVSLIDKSSKRVNVLVNRDGKAQYCRLEDFPAALLDVIRREKRDWNLDVYALSIPKFFIEKLNGLGYIQ